MSLRAAPAGRSGRLVTRLLRAAVSLAVALAGAACAPTPGAPAPAAGGSATGATSGDLVVFGAASLTDVLARVSNAYRAANPGLTIVISTDSSAALATQIEQGAPADVFLSADLENAERLVHDGLTAGDAIAFAGNELAIVVPEGNPAALTTPADLARPGLKIVAAGNEVPITRYATQLVADLARQPGYPPDFVHAYEANVVSREDNVKAVVAKVELGEGDAGIVYRTDAAASSTVDAVRLPAGANVVASYAGVVLRDSPRPAVAAAFLSWLRSPDGQAILASFGFTGPS